LCRVSAWEHGRICGRLFPRQGGPDILPVKSPEFGLSRNSDSGLFRGNGNLQFRIFVSDWCNNCSDLLCSDGMKAPALFAVWTGLFATTAVSTLPAAPPPVVINEIHFEPADKRATEFIEIYNFGSASVDVSHWSLEKFVFPGGFVVPAGGYAVVAADPAAFKQEFGFDPLGPFPGRLKHGGETLRLRDSQGRLVDTVAYGSSFPWPTAAAGDGSSLERVHPGLPSQSPSTWRSSGFPVVSGSSKAVVGCSDPSWHWRAGDSEASTPRAAWRGLEFSEDASWKPARLSIGYGDDDDLTVIPEMQGRYTCVFLRKTFELNQNPENEPLVARVRVDDGCIVWLNGVEILRLNLPSGDLPFHATASDHEAGPEFEVYPLPDAHRHLRKGKNVVAVQVFNVSKDSSDLTFDVELRPQQGAPPAKRPTPNRVNSVSGLRVPPAFLEVEHLPKSPRSADPVRVAARAETGMTHVVLEYQVVDPGMYIRLSDPAYLSSWNQIPMNDSGVDGDQVAGDQVFTAMVPGDVQKNRRLVRYRLRGKGLDGTESVVPREDDPIPNRAWFVCDKFPPYQGAIRPRTSETLTFDTAFLETLQSYHLIANAGDVARSQWDGGAHRKRFQGTLVVGGTVQDHILFHNRGQGSAHISGKNKWGLKFNRHHPLSARRNDGSLYQRSWDSLNLNPGLSTPYLPVLCGAGGLDEALSFRAYQLAGVPSAHTHWVQWRVVCDTAGMENQNPFSGDLWGLYLAVQDMDGDWLKELRLPDGNVYSTQSGRKHLARGAVSDQSDWNRFLQEVRQDHPEHWWRQHLNLPAYYGFHAMNRLLANVDLRPDGNHGYYRDPGGRWAPVPWDLDMMFVPRHHQPGIIDAVRCLNVPVIRREYQNRAREILDLFCADSTPDGGQVGQLVAELSGYLMPRGHERNWTELDAVHWNFHPRKNGHDLFFRQSTFGDHFGGRWERRLMSPDFAGFCRYFLDFMTDSRPEKNYQPNDGNPLGYGYGYLRHEAAEKGIPGRPVVRRVGAQGFAISDYASASGSAFHALEWRIAAVGGPHGENKKSLAYELEPVWSRRSGVLEDAHLVLPSGVLHPGQAYRLRARYEDAEHRTSHWSEPVLLFLNP
jgi:hypothetical protein